MAKYPPKNGKRALVTGITGQDGSYLAELLLAKGYEVYGTLRRSSSLNTGRINHIYQDPHDSDVRLRLEYSDLADGSSLNQLIKTIGPHEIYNLGAQSHVRVSFDVPEYTSDITGLGCIRLLEAIRETGVTCRFYQASSSELYGKVVETPQTERTPFYPRSPYACAKAFAFYATRNYRESYGMFAVNGILFNHETVAGNTPMIFKHEDEVEFDIKPISEIVSDELCSGGPTIVDESRPEYQGGMPTRAVLVWDREGFTRIKYASAYPHRPDEEPKDPRLINARKSAVMATGSHGFIMADGDEKSASQLQIGDRVALCPFPEGANSPAPYADGEAFLLGKMAADGWISRDARRAKFTSASAEARQEFANLWQSLGGTSRFNPTVSGFSGKPVGQLVLNGRADWLRAIDLYNRELTPFGHRTKRVPRAILNAPIATQREFLRGYNSGDGLKSNPCQYEFRNFKTNSATLALGLVYLVHRVTGQDYNVTVEESDAHGKTQFYYSLNLLSDQLTSEDKADVVRELVAAGSSQRGVARESGISRTFIRKIQQGGAPRTIHHLKRPGDEVKKIIDMPQYAGWFYDLETESGTFHCGVGQGHVHNSPRRGETFVTRKITRAAARIADGKQECLYLGNLDARRDWGFAGDYVDAMWRMLQVEEPEDFVIATGEMHSVREFCDLSFGMLGMPLEWRGGGIEEVGVDQAGKIRVRVDARYFRPAEVDLLLGDASYALAKLGWKPTVSFKELVQMMVESDRALTAAP